MVIWTQCVIFKLPRRLHAFTQRVFRSTCGYVYTIPIVLLLRQRQNLLLDDDARYSTSFLLLPLNHKARKKHYLNDLKKVEYSFSVYIPFFMHSNISCNINICKKIGKVPLEIWQHPPKSSRSADLPSGGRRGGSGRLQTSEGARLSHATLQW